MTAKSSTPRLNLEIVRAKDVEATEIDWLWRDRIPAGMFSLIFGRAGQGKSTFTCLLAADVSRTRGNVLFSNTEDVWGGVIRPRLEASNARLDRVHLTNGLIFPNDLDVLEELIAKYDAKLVVLDPVSAHFRVSVDNPQECRIALTPLTKLAERTGCSIVGIHHANKNIKKSGHPLDAIGGAAGGLPAAARAVFCFGPNPHDDDERVLCHVKDNVGAERDAVLFGTDEQQIAVAGGKEVSVVRLQLLDLGAKVKAMQVLAPGKDEKNNQQPVKMAHAAAFLTDLLCYGPVAANEVKAEAEESGVSGATLRRAANDVGIIKARQGSGAGSFVVWMLPPHHPALVEAGTDDCCDNADVQTDARGVIRCRNCHTVIGTDPTPVDDAPEDNGGDDDPDDDGNGGPCCDSPELDVSADGTIVCTKCKHVHGRQLDVDALLDELNEGEAA